MSGPSEHRPFLVVLPCTSVAGPSAKPLTLVSGKATRARVRPIRPCHAAARGAQAGSGMRTEVLGR